MRFATLNINNSPTVCVLNQRLDRAAEISSFKLSNDYFDMINIIETLTLEDSEKLKSYVSGEVKSHIIEHDYASSEKLAPIPEPRYDVICLGMNYSDHALEFKAEAPKFPIFFSKRAAITIGHDSAVCGHHHIDPDFDYEVELAVIIGKKCKNVAPDDVEDCIFGYTILNDFSSRQLQTRHQQWYLGKSGDTSTAFGPWIVTKDELPFPLELDLCSRVNGEVRQNSNTKFFLFDIKTIITTITQTITLKPGDIIATGTPAGVGMGFTPPLFLSSGDVVECEIEKIGVLKNTIE